MPSRPHRLEPNYPGPHVVTTKTPAPPVVVECWCLMVATMNRVSLAMSPRETWRTFAPPDLEPLERQFATSRLTTSHVDAASEPPVPPRDTRPEPPRSTVRDSRRGDRGSGAART